MIDAVRMSAAKGSWQAVATVKYATKELSCIERNFVSPYESTILSWRIDIIDQYLQASVKYIEIRSMDDKSV